MTPGESGSRAKPVEQRLPGRIERSTCFVGEIVAAVATELDVRQHDQLFFLSGLQMRQEGGSGAVNVTPRRCRSNSCLPRAAPGSFICWLTAAWVRPISLPASVKFSCRAAASTLGPTGEAGRSRGLS